MTRPSLCLGLITVSLAATIGCGDENEETTTVTETVTAPPVDTTVAVPDVRRRTLSDAEERLEQRGLRSSVRRKVSDQPAGRVIEQEPGGGVRVERDTVVELVVAKRRPAPKTVRCGDLVESGAGTYDVRATGVDCETAIVVARQWESECASASDGSCEVTLGFACAYAQTGYELGSITCTMGDRKVSFQTGS